MFPLRIRCLLLLLLWLTLPAPFAAAQPSPDHSAPDKSPETESAPAIPAEIADEPRQIDPALLLPAPLAAKATVEFNEAPLADVVRWLRAERKLNVMVDRLAIKGANLDGLTITDRLVDAPVYLLLNRLQSANVSWYYREGILYLTLTDGAETRLTTAAYNVDHLLAAGYARDDLDAIISAAIEQNSWVGLGGTGVQTWLGNQLFIRQTDPLQRRVQALLKGLEKPGRQTFLCDPPEHLAIREKLKQVTSVDFAATPLSETLEILANSTKIDIRRDRSAMNGIPWADPVDLELANVKVESVLDALSLGRPMTWLLRDGVLWIVSDDQDAWPMATALYDVSDLARNQAETYALRNAIVEQTTETWDELGYYGHIGVAKAGVLVVSNSELIHAEVLALLQQYRAAQQAAPPRPYEPDDPLAPVTYYYRLDAKMAADLLPWIPKAVEPRTWQSQQFPDAPGQIKLLASAPQVTSHPAEQVAESKESDSAKGEKFVVVSARAVLVIRQTPAVHTQINELIQRVAYGHNPGDGTFGFICSGITDGGGFGSQLLRGIGAGGLGLPAGAVDGGQFSVPNEPLKKRPR